MKAVSANRDKLTVFAYLLEHDGFLMVLLTFRYQVHGVVQGVGFRQFTCQKARSLGLKGYVRNCEDGSVECIAQGNQEQLNRLYQALENGPSLSRVTFINKERVQVPVAKGFDIVY